MDKKIKKLIKKRHEIIKNNQNAKHYVLRRLTRNIDSSIKKHILDEIRRLNTVLWERERCDELLFAKVEKGQEILRI